MVVCPVHKSAKKTPAPVWSKTMNGDEALAVTTANHFTAPVRPRGFPKSDTLFYLQRACDCSDRLPLPVVHKSSNTSPNTVTRKRLTVFVTNRRRLRATKAARRRCWNAWRSAPGRRRTRLEGQSIDELTLIGWTLTLTRLTKTK